MGLEGVQGPPGSQVFWLILLKLWCIKSESKGPITFLNMVINPKTLLIMQIFHLPLIGINSTTLFFVCNQEDEYPVSSLVPCHGMLYSVAILL